MKYFNCRVRLGGSVLHEVPKQNVSEIEINLFRAIHGPDSVVGIKRHCETAISQEDELRRLGDIYGDPVVEKALGVKIVRFGAVEEDPDDGDDVVVPTPQPAAEQQPAQAKAVLE